MLKQLIVQVYEVHNGIGPFFSWLVVEGDCIILLETLYKRTLLKRTWLANMLNVFKQVKRQALTKSYNAKIKMNAPVTECH